MGYREVNWENIQNFIKGDKRKAEKPQIVINFVQ